MTKPYIVTCPDPDCEFEFTTEQDPILLASGDADLITCPECKEEWEYDYYSDSEGDVLELLAGEDEDFKDDEDEDDGGLDRYAFEDEEEDELA